MEVDRSRTYIWFTLVTIFACYTGSFGARQPPPSIYKWIEENAHICTSVPANGESLINFLSEEEGLNCSLCPETPPRQLPATACAVELSPNDIDVDIGCHPVPELCVLELRTRYAEFFTPPTGPPIMRTEEEIFMATANPFNGNSLNGGTTQSTTTSTTTTTTSTTTTTTPSTTTEPATVRSTEGMPQSSSSEQQFSSFIPLDASTEISSGPFTQNGILLPADDNRRLLLVDNAADTLATDFTTAFPPPETVTVKETVQFETQFEFPTLMSESPTEETTTVRADVFASPAGFSGVPINFSMSGMSVVSRTAQPMGRFAAALFNREAVPEFQPGPGRIPIILSKRLETHQVRTTADGEPICEDTHLLCCFWAIAGECDTNPFWMRTHCAKTCGTCNCTLRFADQCISSGINCTIPTVPTRPSTTPSTPPPTTTPTTMPTPPPTTPGTLPTTAHPSPQPPAARPPSHSGGGWQARPLPTVLPNFPLSLPTVIPPPPQEHDGGNAIWPETVGKHVKTDAGGGAPYDPYSGTAPEFGEASNDDANVQFVFAETSEATLFPTSPATEATTPTTPAATTTATSTTPEPTTKPNCFNYHRLCPFWADLGECTKNPFWMRPHCQKACKSCGETLEDVYAPKPKTGCANRHTLCPFWAFIGECARNPRWMLINCRPSCQVC